MSQSISEPLLKAILETVVDGIITIDEKGTIFSVNPAAEAIFGYPSTELIGQNVKMLMPEPFHSNHDEYLANYLGTGDKKIIGIGREVLGKRKDGTTFAMDLAVSEMQVDGKRMFSGIVRDISERQRLEEESLNRENRLRALIDTMVDGVIVINNKGKIQSFNPAAERLFGHKKEMVIGHNVNILMPEPYKSAHDGYLHNFLKTGERKIIGIGREVVGLKSDGSTFPMELAVSETKVNGELMFTGIVRDISERKAAEVAIAEKNRDLAASSAFDRTYAKITSLFTASFDQELVLKQVLQILSQDHQFVVSAFYLLDQWLGQLVCVASEGLPKDFERHIALGEGLVGKVAEDKESMLLTSPQTMPFKIDTGLNNIEPNALLLSPITYSNTALGVIVLSSIEPISEHKCRFIARLSSQLGVSLNNIQQYQALKSLSEQLKERSLENSRKNTELQQANRLKSEFLANMSHELRTPLNAIIGFSEVLKDQLLGALTEEQLDYVNEIFMSADHLLHLINDILDLSKIEAGKMELSLAKTHIGSLLENSLTIIREKAHAHNIKLSLTVEDGIETAMLDARKIKQVLFNLLSNAVKFTPDGGSVTVKAFSEQDQICVDVSDTGIGIDEKQLGLLFRPFEQLDGSLSREYEGTGLGLVMVKRLIELHNGSVSVNSQKNAGSTFSFKIPYLQTADQATSSGSANKSLTQEGRSLKNLDHNNVVFCSDNQQIIQLITNELPSNFVVQTLSSKQQQKASKQHFESLYPAIVDLSQSAALWQKIIALFAETKLTSYLDILALLDAPELNKARMLGAITLLPQTPSKHQLLTTIEHLDPQATEHKHPILVVDNDATRVAHIENTLQQTGVLSFHASDSEQCLSLVSEIKPTVAIIHLDTKPGNGFDLLVRLRLSQQTANLPIIVLLPETLVESKLQEIAQISEKYAHLCNQEYADLVRQLSIALIKTKVNPTSSKDAPTVLLVDDDIKQSKVTMLYLEEAGLNVVYAQDGEQGIALLRQLQPQLVILDLLMPKMDGLSFLEAKSRIKSCFHIPVFILSAVPEKFGKVSVKAEAVVSKPLSKRDFLTVLSSFPDPHHAEHLSQQKILVIDDDPATSKIISNYIDKDKYRLLSAFDGKSGIEIAEIEQPDIIILDLVMPEMSGFDVLQKLRASPTLQHLHVIILTSKELTVEEFAKLHNQVEQAVAKQDLDKVSLVNQVLNILNRASINVHNRSNRR